LIAPLGLCRSMLALGPNEAPVYEARKNPALKPSSNY
jgi:hypothetical protein